MRKGEGWKSLLLGVAALLIMLSPRDEVSPVIFSLILNAVTIAPGVLITLLVWIVHRRLTRGRPPATFLHRVNRLSILFLGIGICYGAIILFLGARDYALRTLLIYAAPAPFVFLLGHAWHFAAKLLEAKSAPPSPE